MLPGRGQCDIACHCRRRDIDLANNNRNIAPFWNGECPESFVPWVTNLFVAWICPNTKRAPHRDRPAKPSVAVLVQLFGKPSEWSPLESQLLYQIGQLKIAWMDAKGLDKS